MLKLPPLPNQLRKIEICETSTLKDVHKILKITSLDYAKKDQKLGTFVRCPLIEAHLHNQETRLTLTARSSIAFTFLLPNTQNAEESEFSDYLQSPLKRNNKINYKYGKPAQLIFFTE